MYIIKIQGTRKVPDFIQIRDDDFTLVAYFRINNPRRALIRCNLLGKQEQIITLARDLAYGKILKLET
jgi:hypothetical protein